MFFVSFYISVFFRSWRENGSFKVKNANFGSQNWIGFEKRKSTSKNKRQVCAIVCNKISQCGIKRDRYFVDEVETQLTEKPLRGSQTQDIHYLEDKARYKAVTLTYPDAVVVPCSLTCNPTQTLPNQVSYLKGSSMESFTLGSSPKIDFSCSSATTHLQWLEREQDNSLSSEGIQYRILAVLNAQGPLFVG
jgi:hypothetical protein